MLTIPSDIKIRFSSDVVNLKLSRYKGVNVYPIVASNISRYLAHLFEICGHKYDKSHVHQINSDCHSLGITRDMCAGTLNMLQQCLTQSRCLDIFITTEGKGEKRVFKMKIVFSKPEATFKIRFKIVETNPHVPLPIIHLKPIDAHFK